MIKHIILWKLKSEMTAEEKSAAKLEAKTRLEGLNGKTALMKEEPMEPAPPMTHTLLFLISA